MELWCVCDVDYNDERYPSFAVAVENYEELEARRSELFPLIKKVISYDDRTTVEENTFMSFWDENLNAYRWEYKGTYPEGLNYDATWRICVKKLHCIWGKPNAT